MAIPEINEQNINEALKYIDEKGVPFHNQSTKYELVKDGKKYPPKYVVAVADHIANNVEISTAGFNAVEAKYFLKGIGFTIKQKPNCKENPYSSTLLKSKNLIFHGAPGTGKTFLAKKIAADIVSDGDCDNFPELSDEEKSRIGFVQFHPSYDYTDFVEGLRPITKDGSVGFERRDGVFMKFVNRARENFEISKGLSAEKQLDYFLKHIKLGDDEDATIFETVGQHTKFSIKSESLNDKSILFKGHGRDADPERKFNDPQSINKNKIIKLLESKEEIKELSDVKRILETDSDARPSYILPIYKAIKEEIAKLEKQKKFVFIIDEINRGEISKIFGELFFSIDPDYRGENGAVATQYANLHDDPDEKFYIPENVYIIGTMNDIDRSVDTFDFAMRRRFRFAEITADDSIEMLEDLGDEELTEKAVERMTKLNEAIANTEGLNKNYQIGGAYFLKLDELGGDFEKLWEDYLEPLLQEYVRGTGTSEDEENAMRKFEKAYGYEGGAGAPKDVKSVGEEPAEDDENEDEEE